MSLAMWYGFVALLGSANLVQSDFACDSQTGGTCNFLDCSPSRGPAVCTKVSFFSSECLCSPGTCNVGGRCVDAAIASQPTTTTPPPTTAPPPPPPVDAGGDPHCETAYAHGCWSAAPFNTCCHSCQSATYQQVCKWSYKMPCCPIAESEFTFNPDDSAGCTEACLALGAESNVYQDYCPGGKVDVAVQGCPAAKTSFDSAMKLFFSNPEHNNFCEDAHVMKCSWSFSVYEVSDKQTHTITGSYTYSDPTTAVACSQACSFLGLSNNRPEYYCPSGQLASSLQSCAPALQSLKDSPGDWCSTSSVEFVQIGGNHTIASAANVQKKDSVLPISLSNGRSEVKDVQASPVLDLKNNQTLGDGLILSSLAQTCVDAFTKHTCWNKTPFKDCCGQCEKGKKTASYKCHWEFEVDDIAGMTPKVFGDLASYPGETLMQWAPCDNACQLLKQPHNRFEFCNPNCGADGPMLQRIGSGCPDAITSFQSNCNNPDRAAWCATQTSSFSMVSVRPDSVLAVTVAALALVTAAATVVKCRSRSIAGEDGYEPFMG